MRKILVNPKFKSLAPIKEFLDETETFTRLIHFFGSDTNGWPAVLKENQQNAIMLWALGGCLGYLDKLNILNTMISQKNFCYFDVLRQRDALVLDGQTLSNLSVLENDLGGTEGTLLHFMDHTITPFGKRMFREWLCHPLRAIDSINHRLDAVEDLIQHPPLKGIFLFFEKLILNFFIVSN